MSFSSIGIEVLGAATSADRSGLMVEGFQALHGAESRLPLFRTVESLGLHAAITTVQKVKDYRLRPTVGRLYHPLKTSEIALLQKIAGAKNIADVLNKRNPSMYQWPNAICIAGIIQKE